MEGERRSSEDLNGDSLTKATPARIDESSKIISLNCLVGAN